MLNISVKSAALWTECRLPEGVSVHMLSPEPAIQNDWLAWYPAKAQLLDAQTGGGLLTAKRMETACFMEAEAHMQPEIFMILSGDATMLLPDANGWQLVRLPQGTVMRIGSGVPHYFGPALTPQVLCAVINHPAAVTEMIPL